MAVLLALGALACAVAAPLPHAHTTTLPESINGHAEDGAPDFEFDDFCAMNFDQCVYECKILVDTVDDYEKDYKFYLDFINYDDLFD